MPPGKRRHGFCHHLIFCLGMKMFPTYFMVSSYLTIYVLSCNPGADPGFDWGEGDPDCDRPKLAMVRSSIMQAKQALFSVGSRAHLRALEALGYFITKYAFSPFWGTFLYYF